MVRRLAVLLCASALLSACGVALSSNSSGTAKATPTPTATPSFFVGTGFSVGVPQGWFAQTIADRGNNGKVYGLASRNVRLPENGVVPDGVVAIQIGFVPASAIPASAGDPSTMTPAELVNTMVGVPTGATNVEHSPVLTTTLSGASAGEMTTTYSYQGVSRTDVDLVAYHDGTIYFVELETPPQLLSQGQQALTTVVQSLSWD